MQNGMKIIERGDVKKILLKWRDGLLSAREVHAWAENRYNVNGYNCSDWEGDEELSVTNEVLSAQDRLDMNLMTVEDIPVYLEFLETPIGEFDSGMLKFEQYLDSINYKERKKKLAEVELYALFCK